MSEAVFETHAADYDAWFERHPAVYASELAALRPGRGRGGLWVEVGAGTGRFAQPLDIALGIEPSAAMAARARARGLTLVRGRGERLPLRSGCVDGVLFVTTLCFLDDIDAAFAEAARVLRRGGRLLAGFIDRGSPLGADYLRRQADHPCYRFAHFHDAADIAARLARAGLQVQGRWQTLFRNPAETDSPEPVRPGSGEGGFVVVAADKPEGAQHVG